MFSTANVTRNCLSRILAYESVSSVVNKCSIQEINVQCRRNIGYVGLHPEKYSNKSNVFKTINCNVTRKFSSNNNARLSSKLDITPVQFEKLSDETLDSLTEYFDELIERARHLADADVSYGDGVLTVKFGDPYGTYVINRQTPNKQIWLSSPTSGPKRYDFVNGKWIYKHDGKTLHELLNNEIPAIVRDQTNFDKCCFSGKEKEAALNSL